MSKLIPIAKALSNAVSKLSFGDPVAQVYNPLDYAWAAHEQYLRRFGRGKGKVLLLGMNPGPWGMVQTGVPFGEVAHVRDWLKIDAPIGKPVSEHPKRIVEGLSCARSEVSGRRLWGLFRERFGTPRRMFAHMFVANYCPLVFMEASARNRTPDKLKAAEREPLFAACDAALRQTVEAIKPRLVVGVGRFAEDRSRSALSGMGVDIGRILHPSPASPKANRGWAGFAVAELAALGVELPDPA
ncbi:MAG: uracil-DNA glycosylase family protein [Planctomycetota bacterium]|jgi:single-strand selective monofunctional uracil DNA glycosylase